jgi:hypothetical protein
MPKKTVSFLTRSATPQPNLKLTTSLSHSFMMIPQRQIVTSHSIPLFPPLQLCLPQLFFLQPFIQTPPPRIPPPHLILSHTTISSFVAPLVASARRSCSSCFLLLPFCRIKRGAVRLGDMRGSYSCQLGYNRVISSFTFQKYQECFAFILMS